MALANTIEWEVRTTGNDLNGGGFKAGASGTDYSQQDSPQLSNTDLAIDATFNTKVSSAGSPFTSASVGNVIQVSAGTGFTTGFYEVTAVVAGLATVDRAIGTTSSTGGTFRLGGGLLTVSKGLGAMTDNNVVWVKSGTYTITSTITQPNLTSTYLKGYQTTHGDNTGTKPLITSATNSVALITTFASFTATTMVIKNINFSHTAGTRGPGVTASLSTNTRGLIVVDCIFDGCSYGFYGDFITPYGFLYLSLVGCEIKNSVNDGIINAGLTYCMGCYIHDNGRDGICAPSAGGANVAIVVNHCVLDTNVAKAIRYANAQYGGGVVAYNSCFYNNGGGIYIASANQSGNSTVVNCIFEANTVALSGDASGVAYRTANAFYNNGANLSSPSNNYPFIADSSDISLSGSPFTNAASGDFTLNSTAGAGAACKAVGFPGAIPNAGTSSNFDIGALQSGSGGGGGGGIMLNPSLEGL